MKITSVETIRLRGPQFPQAIYPAWTPGGQWTSFSSSLIKVTTDEGIVGWGAAYPADLPKVDELIAPRLIGQDPFLLEQHARLFRNAGGATGTEIALWDIIGKAVGQPLFRLWGAYRDRVPAYASCVEVRSGAQRAEDAQRARAGGWRAMKLRLHDWTMAADIAQVAGVRAAMGEEFVILTDANQAQQPGTPQPEEGPVWTYERAVQTARELQRMGVYWLEEPLDRYNFKDLRRLCDAADILIAGGENNRGLHEFRTLVEDDVYDILQPECLVTETMSGLRKIAALAEMHHKRVAPHHGGGGVGIAAHLHLACAIPNGTYFELLHEPPGMTADDFQWYLQEPVRVDAEGNVRAPTGPGLGVEPDPDKLAHYRMG